MYHSIDFDMKNTWRDWHLIPSSRPVFAPPPVKFKYVDIPGSDGQLDLTTALAEYPGYGNRTGSLEFIVANGYLSWVETYADISAYLHGKVIRAVLEDNPDHFYRGCFTINAWRSDKSHSLLVLDYDVGPYKTELFGASDAWLWDPFDFEFGEVQYYTNIPVNGTLDLTIEAASTAVEIWLWDSFDFEFGSIQNFSDLGFDRPNSPTFTTSVPMSVTFNGVTYPLIIGSCKIPEIELADGSNVFTFTGNGTISIEYGRRSL